MVSTKFSYLTVQFQKADIPANATTDLTLPGGNAGLKVPEGYEFTPFLVQGSLNDFPTAGTAVFKVTKDGEEISPGPEANLSDEVQAAVDVIRVGAIAGVPAGSVVGVSVTTSADFAAETLDADGILIGLMKPAN